MSTSSQHNAPMAAANEPMDMDPHPTTASMSTAPTPPHGPPQTAGAEGPAPPSHVHSGQQVCACVHVCVRAYVCHSTIYPNSLQLQMSQCAAQAAQFAGRIDVQSNINYVTAASQYT